MSLTSKKILVGALGVATVLSLVSTAAVLTASAQTATFTGYLSVGSTGTEVTALQQHLASAGFFTVAPTGYFGSITKAAVAAWQASIGLPSTGYFGPLSVAAMNSSSVAMVSSTPGCAAGALFSSTTGAPCAPTTTSMTPGCSAGALFSSTTGAPCAPTPITTTTANCPVDYTCTANMTSTLPTNVISTPGQIGSISLASQSSPNNTTVYKGQSYNVAQYKLQATGASDMAVQNLTLNFDFRPWLYAGSITVTDEAGNVIGQVNNLSQSNFSEITVGSNYSLSIPLSNYVVKVGQTDYLTINMSFLPTSDRDTGTINIIGAQVRAVDGTGVAVTESDSNTQPDRAIDYYGSGAGQIVVTTDPSSPVTGTVQLSTGSVTQNVPLAVYDIKSENAASTLNTLNVNLQTNNNVSPTTLFQNVKLVIGGVTYTADTFDASSTATVTNAMATFDNLTVNLPADTYIPLIIQADAAVDTNGTLDNTIASTTFSVGGTVGGTSNNPSVEDQSYNTLLVNGAIFTSNPLTFTASSVNESGLSVSYGSAIQNPNTGTTTQQFTYNFSLTAGNNPIYVSTAPSTALGTSSALSGITVANLDFRDTSSAGTSGDTSSYFYVSPGQTKTFEATFTATGIGSGTYTVNQIYYGTTSGALQAASLSDSNLANNLYVQLFH